MSATVLALNAGSSSLKFALFDAAADETAAPLLRGQVEGLGRPSARLVARDAEGRKVADRDLGAGVALAHHDVLDAVFGLARDASAGEPPQTVGHRIVHGGSQFVRPTRLAADVLSRLEALTPLAPLHQPPALAVVRAAMQAEPRALQIGCFDTAFHASMPKVARRFALTRELEAQGVVRYGFHGLSYAFIARRLASLDPELLQGRTILAHLGGGASLCALQAGASVDTTMGFTAVDGLVMGARCGALDPGVVLYLIQALGWSADEVEDLIYRRSGLLGMSGISSDMRELEASDRPEAAEAIDLFVWRLAREAGGLAASLEGLDGLVFTGGIGEHSARVRQAACRRLAWLGVEIDPAANGRAEAVISTPASRVRVRVIPTDEERMIVLQCAALAED